MLMAEPGLFMYAFASDESRGTLLGIFSGANLTEAHYALSLSEMDRVDRIAAGRGIPFVYVVIADNDVPRPPAVWRKRFSDANFGVKADRFFFVMVTTSMLIRGVYTAVNWVTEKREGQQYGVVGNVDDAQRWLKAHGAEAGDLVALERHSRVVLARELGMVARSG
jgi:hypothetical protein